MGEAGRLSGGIEALRLRVARVNESETSFRGLLRSERTFAFLLTLPTILIVAIISLYPSVYAIYISLTNYNPSAGVAKFIGLQNYVSVAGSAPFQHALQHTAWFTILAVCLGTILGLTMALLLNEKFVGRGALRSAMLVPWALPGVGIGIVWTWAFDGTYGTINGLLYNLGIINDYVAWLQYGWVALDIVAVVFVWNQAPMAAILFLAGLQAIPPNLYRAAKVDGAGPIDRFRHITLPWLKNVLVLVLILSTLNAITAFDLIYVMTKGGPGDDTTVFSWLGYLTIFNFFQFGRGSAILLILSIISLLLGVVYMRTILRVGRKVTLGDQGEADKQLILARVSLARRERKGPFRAPRQYHVFSPRVAFLVGRALLYAVGILVALWSLMPLFWMVSTSLMPFADLTDRPAKLLPIPPTLDNYQAMISMVRGFFGGPLPNEVHVAEKVPSALRNSFIVAGGTALSSVVFGSLAGYSFARFSRFKFLKVTLVAVLLTKLVPALAIVVPWFIMFKALHLIDSKLGLIISYSSFTIPIVLFVMRSYFEGIPINLERAAWVDGCTRLQALRRVIMPVALPGAIAGAIFTFILAWNEFFFALNLTTTPNSQTISVIMGQLATDLLFQPSSQGVLMAVCSTAVVIPVLVAFIFQRYLIQGLIAGSGKG